MSNAYIVIYAYGFVILLKYHIKYDMSLELYSINELCFKLKY